MRNQRIDGGPMRVRSLPGHVLRSAHIASSPIGVAARNSDSASGRDADIGWRHARARDLSAADTAAPAQTVRSACRLSSGSVGAPPPKSAESASDWPFVGLLSVHSWSDLHGR